LEWISSDRVLVLILLGSQGDYTDDSTSWLNIIISPQHRTSMGGLKISIQWACTRCLLCASVNKPSCCVQGQLLRVPHALPSTSGLTEVTLKDHLMPGC
jgi:hypothetical protein